MSISVKPEWQDRVTLSVEDYLHGVITLVNELASGRIPENWGDTYAFRAVSSRRQLRDPRRFRATYRNFSICEGHIRWFFYGPHS